MTKDKGQKPEKPKKNVPHPDGKSEHINYLDKIKNTPKRRHENGHKSDNNNHGEPSLQR